MHAFDVHEALYLILIFKALRSVVQDLIVKCIETRKNISTPTRMHLRKTKRMIMMSINSITVKFMAPVLVVKVLRRTNMAIKCTCKCKK